MCPPPNCTHALDHDQKVLCMTVRIIKLQKASKVNTFLTFLFSLSRFGGVYSTFIDVTRF